MLAALLLICLFAMLLLPSRAALRGADARDISVLGAPTSLCPMPRSSLPDDLELLGGFEQLDDEVRARADERAAVTPAANVQHLEPGLHRVAAHEVVFELVRGRLALTAGRLLGGCGARGERERGGADCE